MGIESVIDVILYFGDELYIGNVFDIVMGKFFLYSGCEKVVYILVVVKGSIL